MLNEKHAHINLEEEIEKINACVHCGYCLPACPTYISTGNEGNSPRGRLYLIKDLIRDGKEELEDTAKNYLDNCLGCMACETACPSGVEYTDLLEFARHDREQSKYHKGFWGFIRRQAFKYILPNRLLLNMARISLRVMNFIYKLLPFLPRLVKIQPKLEFEYKKIETDSFYPSLENLDGIDNPEHTVILNLGCVMDTIYNQVHLDTIKVLNAIGYHVYVPSSKCCGALASHSGEHALGEKQKQDFLKKQKTTIDGIPVNKVVFNSAGCGAFIKESEDLDPELELYDIAELLDINNWKAPLPLANFKKKIEVADSRLMSFFGEIDASEEMSVDITYHPACHLSHAQGIRGVYEEILKLMQRVNLKTLYEAEVCCGSAGFYNLIKPDLADDIGKRKAENIQNTEAKFVVTANPGCMSQIEAHLPDDYEVVHPMTLLAAVLT